MASRSGGYLVAIPLADAWQMFSYLSTGVVIGILASFLTPRQSTEQLNRFFTLIHTKVRPDEKISSPCTLPEDSLPRGVALIIWFTSFLAGVL
jgi:hypothetical protein